MINNLSNSISRFKFANELPRVAAACGCLTDAQKLFKRTIRNSAVVLQQLQKAECFQPGLVLLDFLINLSTRRNSGGDYDEILADRSYV